MTQSLIKLIKLMRGNEMNSNKKLIFSRKNVFSITARKVSKYGEFSGPYFPVFSPEAGKYGPEITPYFHTFHAVNNT